LQSRTLRLKVLSEIEQAQSLLANQPGVGQVYPVNGHLDVEFVGDEEAAADLLNALVSGGVRLASFSETISDLEEVFLRLTKGEVA
jgi:ABC-2 type transport system ATP-binding protein